MKLAQKTGELNSTKKHKTATISSQTVTKKTISEYLKSPVKISARHLP